MLTWGRFRRSAPELAAAGRELLYQNGVGLAFLGTVRADGGPRVHPVGPILVEDGLFALLSVSEKLADLLRDGRFALHSFPAAAEEDAFYVTGQVGFPAELSLRRSVAAAFLAERGLSAPPPGVARRRPLRRHRARRQLAGSSARPTRLRRQRAGSGGVQRRGR